MQTAISAQSAYSLWHFNAGTISGGEDINAPCEKQHRVISVVYTYKVEKKLQKLDQFHRLEC